MSITEENVKTEEVPSETGPQEKVVRVPSSLAQAVVNYLATRPYQEVAGLITGLTSLPFEEG